MAYRGNWVFGMAAATVALTMLSAPQASARGAREPVIIAILERLQADVRVVRGGATLKGVSKQPLAKADLVRTGSGSRALIQFVDGSLLTLGEVAEAILDDYAMDTHRRSGTMFVDIIKGAFRFRSGGMGEISDNRVEIRTPVATLALRDQAELWGGPIDGSHGIFVVSGRVEARNDAGSVVLGRAQNGTMVMTLSHPPDRPQTWGRDKLNRANAMVSFK